MIRVPTKRIRFTRDSVCMGDDVDAPHERWLEIDPAADAEAVAGHLLAGGYLAHVGSDATWILTLGRDRVVFGFRAGRPFIMPVEVGEPVARAAQVEGVHVGYAAQQAPEAVANRMRRSGLHP